MHLKPKVDHLGIRIIRDLKREESVVGPRRIVKVLNRPNPLAIDSFRPITEITIDHDSISGDGKTEGTVVRLNLNAERMNE